MKTTLIELADIFDTLSKACRNASKTKAIVLASAKDGIRGLQEDLGVHVDGVFGPITEKAFLNIDVNVLIDKILKSTTPPPHPLPTSIIPLPQPSPIGDTSSQYVEEYEKYFSSMIIDESRLSEIQLIADKILKNATRYQAVASSLGTGYYWPLIGIVHNLESGINFNTHLYNGDPLTHRTIHTPAGRPVLGEPPFTWEFAAADALQYEGWDKWHDWTIDGIAYILEKYNGFGYRNHGIPSPYLWAGSSIYVKGLYTRDGIFDPNAVSKQIGGMTMLKFFVTSGQI